MSLIIEVAKDFQEEESPRVLPFSFVFDEVYGVQDVLSTVSLIIASVSVTLGVVYYLLNARRARKREKLDMVMRIYAAYNNSEFHSADSLLLSTEFTDYDDFVEKYGNPRGREPIHLAVRLVCNAYSLLGLLLFNKLMDIHMVQSVFEVERHWQKVKPLVEAARKELEDPTYLMYFEYLYDEWIAFQEKR